MSIALIAFTIGMVGYLSIVVWLVLDARDGRCKHDEIMHRRTLDQVGRPVVYTTCSDCGSVLREVHW